MCDGGGGVAEIVEIVGEGAAGGEEGAVVQGRSAGDAADAVGAEELFRHERGRTDVRKTSGVRCKKKCSTGLSGSLREGGNWNRNRQELWRGAASVMCYLGAQEWRSARPARLACSAVRGDVE
jgi:hypothetical protein